MMPVQKITIERRVEVLMKFKHKDYDLTTHNSLYMFSSQTWGVHYRRVFNQIS